MNAFRAAFRTNPLIFDSLLAGALVSLGVITLAAGARDIGSYDPSGGRHPRIGEPGGPRA